MLKGLAIGIFLGSMITSITYVLMIAAKKGDEFENE